MTVDLVELAKKKLTETQDRMAELNAELEYLAAESEKWTGFIQAAESLMGEPSARNDEADSHMPSGPRSPLIEGSYAAIAAKFIMEWGPRTLDQIVRAISGHGANIVDIKKFKVSVNSALWRRDDIFVRLDDGRFGLVTRDIVFAPPRRQESDPK